MKQRLTITLSDSTLSKIDRLVDKKNIRNRSHAIEKILESGLQPQISTAVILAGGSTNEKDFRPLTLIDGKPLISHTLELLKRHHIQHIIIATLEEEGRRLQQFLETSADPSLRLEFVFEPQPLGTAGALRNISDKLDGQAFLVISGDVLTTIDLQAMIKFHTDHQAVATLAVKPRSAQKTYDNVFLEGSTVIDFKANNDEQVVSIVNAGVYLFEPAVLRLIPTTSPSSLERDVFPKLAKTGKLLAFPFQGWWFDITSDDTYQQALAKNARATRAKTADTKQVS